MAVVLAVCGFCTSIVTLASCIWVLCWPLCKKAEMNTDGCALIVAFWPLMVSPMAASIGNRLVR